MQETHRVCPVQPSATYMKNLGLREATQLLPGSGVGSASRLPHTPFPFPSNLSWILIQVGETEHTDQTLYVMCPPVTTVTLGQVLRTLVLVSSPLPHSQGSPYRASPPQEGLWQAGVTREPITPADGCKGCGGTPPCPLKPQAEPSLALNWVGHEWLPEAAEGGIGHTGRIHTQPRLSGGVGGQE